MFVCVCPNCYDFFFVVVVVVVYCLSISLVCCLLPAKLFFPVIKEKEKKSSEEKSPDTTSKTTSVHTVYNIYIYIPRTNVNNICFDFRGQPISLKLNWIILYRCVLLRQGGERDMVDVDNLGPGLGVSVIFSIYDSMCDWFRGNRNHFHI